MPNHVDVKSLSISKQTLTQVNGVKDLYVLLHTVGAEKKVTIVSVTRVQDLWVLVHNALHCPTTTEQLNGTYTNIYSSAKWLVLVQYH